MTDKARERKLASELHEHRDDAGEWSEEAVDIEVKPSRSTVVSFRLPTEEFYTLHDAAKAANESLSEFVRKAIALRLHGEVTAAPSLEITSGVYRLQVSTIPTSASARRTENPSTSEVPEKPLKYVAHTQLPLY